MKRRDMLRPGASGTLSWSVGDRRTIMVAYECHEDRITVNPTPLYSDLDRQPGTQTFRFDTTPCNFGGERRWFLCPGCSRRVAVLCGVNEVFRCRLCHRLPYLSQNTTVLRRLIRRRQDIGKRIFEDGDGRRRHRRKGLHKQTFARKLRHYFEIERQINGMCLMRIDRLRAAMLAH